MIQLNIVLAIIAWSFTLSVLENNDYRVSSFVNNERQISGICQPETERNRNYLESFFLSSNLEQRRIELGIGNITTDDIQILKSPNDDYICEQLNGIHQEAIEYMTQGSPRFEVVNYKAGNYYFVIVQFRLSEDPNRVVVGVQGVQIYDQNLNRIAGISY